MTENAQSMNVTLCDDKAVWDRAILELDGTLYHSWEWGEVRRAEGWLPSRALLVADAKPVAAIQILERRLPVGTGTLLYAPRGIVGATDDPAIIAAIAGFLRLFMRNCRAILLRMDPRFLDSCEAQKALLVANGFRSLPDQWSFWNFPRATMVVNISGSEDDILRKMRRTHRQLIQKALRDGLEVESGTANFQIHEFYSLVLKSSERQGFALRGANHFLNIRQQFSSGDAALVFLCRQHGHPVAAILCACFGTTCHYLHGGFDSEARVPGATEILHWKAIQWAKTRGCLQYDLLGTATDHPPREGNPGYGLYNYKRGFGAELLYSAGYFELVRRELAYRVLRFAEQHPSLIDAALKLRSTF